MMDSREEKGGMELAHKEAMLYSSLQWVWIFQYMVCCPCRQALGAQRDPAGCAGIACGMACMCG